MKKINVLQKTMPINDKSKIIFIHIPKCGGMSLQQVPCLRHQCTHFFGQGHITLDRILKDRTEKYKMYYVFSVVRNPYHRIASAFFYLKKGGMQNHFDKKLRILLKKYKTFHHFVACIRKDRLHEKILHMLPMHHFLCDPNTGNLLTTNIFRLEQDLPKLKKTLLDRKILTSENNFDEVCNTPQNKSNYTQINWDNEKNLKEEIKKIYRKDFILFYPEIL